MSSKRITAKSKVGERLMEQHDKIRLRRSIALGAMVGTFFAWWLTASLVGILISAIVGSAISIALNNLKNIFVQKKIASQTFQPEAVTSKKINPQHQTSKSLEFSANDTLFLSAAASMVPNASWVKRRLHMSMFGAALGLIVGVYLSVSLFMLAVSVLAGGVIALGFYGRSVFHKTLTKPGEAIEADESYILAPPVLPALTPEQVARQEVLHQAARNVYSEVENLVVSGGGGRGIGLIAGLERAETAGLDLTKIKTCVGTSVGTMLAIAVAVNYDMKALRKVFNDLPLTTFKDWGWWSPTRLLTKWGFFRNKGLSNYMQKVIRDKTGLDDPTFAQLRAAGCKDLKIIVGNLNQGCPEIFSADTTPDESVVYASTKSMAVPFVYQPRYGLNEDLYIDGGLFLNYPIRVIPNEDLAKKTLGFLLVGESASATLMDRTPAKIDSMYSYIKRILSCLLLQQVSSLNEEQWDATAIVNTGDYPWMDFTPNYKKRLNLEESAREGVDEHIERLMLKRLELKSAQPSTAKLVEQLKSLAYSTTYTGDYVSLSFSQQAPEAREQAQQIVNSLRPLVPDDSLFFEHTPTGDDVLTLPRALEKPEPAPKSPRGIAAPGVKRSPVFG